MYKKLWIAGILTVLALVVVMSVGYAFMYVSVDGVWRQRLPNNWCYRYATGPTGLDPEGTTGLDARTTYWNQSPPTDDWNQVRRGFNINGNCAAWGSQSGVAFFGVNSGPVDPLDENTPFLLGKFCHINYPIYLPAGSTPADFEFTTFVLDTTVTGLACPPEQNGPYVINPDNSTGPLMSSMTFTFGVTLWETLNQIPCPFQTDPPGPLCPDRIDVAGPANQRFRCITPGTGGADDVLVDYTIAVLGFTYTANQQGDCANVPFDPDNPMMHFISQEGATNCGCMYSEITDKVPLAVTLLDFSGQSTPDGILLSWETANELDNLGFNLYRGTEPQGFTTKLNDSLIPTNVAPGSPFGAEYAFMDTTASPGVTYFYWLEDIDLFGKATLHGPVEIILE